jgi:Phosphatidylserine/phosphatidylglycerophosphate/cardiolipin synthases and related enzymes
MSAGKMHSAYTNNNKVTVVKGGTDYFTLLEQLIQKASNSIYIRIYIWDDDETGTSIANQLILAAKRGVSIFIMADGYASQVLSSGFIKKLRETGIYFHFFEPLLKSRHFYFGRRLHEKLVVVDGYTALIGGVNFADRYRGSSKEDAWLDYAVCLQGQSAKELYDYCRKEFSKSHTSPFPPSPPVDHHACSVRVRYNDWVKGQHQIWRTYFNWFNQSEESITILCSYFLPGRVLRNRMRKAAQRGVRIKLILAGPSDIMLAKYAERYLYRWMLKNGMEIYEYQPSILHAKLMVVDNHWVTIGSYNVNNISTYASKEVNVDIRNKPFASLVQKEMDEIISEDCVPVSVSGPLVQVGWVRRMIQKSSYELIRLILNLTTFYFKQE